MLAYALLASGSYALTQRLDPSLATLDRNRYVGSALAVIGGAVLSAKHPAIGAALAAAGATAAGGMAVAVQLGKVIQKPPTTTTQGLGEVYAPGELGAVYSGDQLGAVYDGMGSLGAIASGYEPSPPWH